MSKYVDIDQIIDDILKKWGCDPAYCINDTPTGIEARRDAELIEFLRGKPSIDIVHCKDCENCDKVELKNGFSEVFCYQHGHFMLSDYFCAGGRRRKSK